MKYTNEQKDLIRATLPAPQAEAVIKANTLGDYEMVADTVGGDVRIEDYKRREFIVHLDGSTERPYSMTERPWGKANQASDYVMSDEDVFEASFGSWT